MSKARRPLCVSLLLGVNALFASSVTSSTPLPATPWRMQSRWMPRGTCISPAFSLRIRKIPTLPLTPSSPSSRLTLRKPCGGPCWQGRMTIALWPCAGPGNSVYVTGKTQSTDFPTTPGAMATSGNTFAAELDAGGKLVYSTYLPRPAVKHRGGYRGPCFHYRHSLSSDALQAPGSSVRAANNISAGFGTAFIMELNPSGSAAVLAIIGFGRNQIALDAREYLRRGRIRRPCRANHSGSLSTSATANNCVTGFAFASPCAFQHIAKIDPTGTHLIYATYLSGTWGASPSASR